MHLDTKRDSDHYPVVFAASRRAAAGSFNSIIGFEDESGKKHEQSHQKCTIKATHNKGTRLPGVLVFTSLAIKRGKVF